MSLKELGYTQSLENFKNSAIDKSLKVGRVITEHKERYIVKTENSELEAEIIGSLRFAANNRTELPAVGDWVAISEYNEKNALVHSILPRKSVLERQEVGKHGEKQIIATNVDFAFIVQAVDRDFNINRIERYLTIINSSNITPTILLTKIDLVEDRKVQNLVNEVLSRIPNTQIITVSNLSCKGVAEILSVIQKRKTYCLLGSSGVGKSSLLNNLIGKQRMITTNISSSNNKGRHATTHRELIVLDNGGIIIDNPGMREVGIADSEVGLKTTFSNISEISKLCKFSNCSHTSEKGCAIIEAIDNGEIDQMAYDNYLKIEREKEHFKLTEAEKRKKDKSFGKMVKNMKKIRGDNNL